MIGIDEAKDTLARALEFVTADHAEAAIWASAEGSTRFANSAITQNVAKETLSLSVSAAFGNRVGSASTTDLSGEGLRAVVQRAEELARMAQPDTEYMPPPEPAEYQPSACYAETTTQVGPEERAEGVCTAIELCRKQGARSAGSFATQSSFFAVANTNGLFAHNRETSARFLVTAMTEDSSGWAESWSRDVTQVSPVDAAQRAVEKALAGRQPRDPEPGRYTVVLEPAAVAEMLAFVCWSLDAKAAHEGRSAFSGKEGQKIAAESVTVFSRPADPRCPGAPVFGDGMPVPDVTWIDRGVLSNLAYSRFWAQKCDHAFTGWPTNLIMEGTDASVDDLVAQVDRGILVTRFWYIRHVDPMKLLLTGMTRDGLFWIEGGKVRHALKNLRFNESAINMLAQVRALGKPELTGDYIPALVPPLLVGEFNFSSTTTF
ncbi:MAG: TldD/PmbA family protein [Armatimonadota bacterium]